MISSIDGPVGFHPLHIKGDMLLIDNSSLSEICACPRRGMYKFLDRRQLVKNRAALFFGGAIHKALEVRDLFNKPLCTGEIEDAMVQALIDYYDGVDMGDDFRNLDFAVKTIRHYNDVYKHDQHPPIALGERLAVELPFAYHVGDIEVNATILVCDPDENEGQPFFKYIGTLRVMFTGKIDRICRYQGQLFDFDHKTSSMGGPNFFSEFYTAMQFRGYKWATEQLIGERVSGVIINGIVCRPPTKTREKNYDMDRHVIHLNDSMVEEWQNTFMLTVQEWVGYVTGQENYPDSPEQSFPLRTGACISKYGTCEYFEVCSLPTSQRPMLLSTPLFEDHSWSPLEDTAKPKKAKAEIDFGGLFDHLG